MTGEITKHFTEDFNEELFVAFQNAGGVMRGRSRRKTGIVGYRTHFPKIGLAATAQQKTRNGKVPLQDIARDRVFCDLVDYYGGDMIDDLDELKTNVEEKGAIQNAIVMSLMRSEDDIALAALAATTNANNSLGANDSFSSDAVPRLLLQQFGAAEAFQGGNMHALVTWASWADLLALNTFVNSQVGGDTRMTVEGVNPKRFYGFDYAPFSRLPLHSSGARLNLFWNPKCLGTAVGKEVTPETAWLSEYSAHLITGKMSQGAVLIESIGAIARRYAS